MTLDEDVDDTLACHGVTPPQPAPLLDGECEPRHLSVLTQNTLDQAGVDRIVLRGHAPPHNEVHDAVLLRFQR
jgi:hypothetical protein